jgi:hypothetical protein
MTEVVNRCYNFLYSSFNSKFGDDMIEFLKKRFKVEGEIPREM